MAKGRKTGGRKPGSRNREVIVRETLKETLQRRDANLVDMVLDLLPHMEPKDAARILLELVPYEYAKVKEPTEPAPAPIQILAQVDRASLMQAAGGVFPSIPATLNDAKVEGDDVD